MARTNATAVQELLGNNYDSNTTAASMARFIRHATNMVDRVVTCATNRGFTHTADELLDLETLLAAHYYSLHDPQYTSKSTGRASGSWERRSYKEEAWDADVSGCLKSIMKGSRAQVVWLGKRKSQQTDYVNRD